jgi:hypothetical protein
MCRFSYFIYRAELPETVQSNLALCCFIVEVSKKELTGSNRNISELQNAARHLIRHSLSDRYVYRENLIDILLRCEPIEIGEEEFRRLKKTRLDPLNSLPGGLYRVKQWLRSRPSARSAVAASTRDG